MPDYPYVYESPALRPIQPGGTRIRLFRRRRREEEEREGQQETAGRGREAAREGVWEELLSDAVAELNASFRQAGSPFRCALEEDEKSFLLVVQREGEPGGPTEVEEEVLSPMDLPLWLARLRLRLGLLVDEKA